MNRAADAPPETRYFIPKTVEVSKWEYDCYVENMRWATMLMPSWWESLISQAIGSL